LKLFICFSIKTITLSSLSPIKKGQPQWLSLNFLHITMCPSIVHSSTWIGLD
jgi:hypothetical protein